MKVDPKRVLVYGLIFLFFGFLFSAPRVTAADLDWMEFNLARDFPAGSHVTFDTDSIDSTDRISVVGDHFEVGGRRLRLFGVNFTASGCFLSQEDAERTAKRLADLGFNFVKFTLIGGKLVDSYDLESDPSEVYLNQTAINELKFFIEKLKENGVYVGLQFDSLVAGLNRPSIYFNEDLIELQKAYIEKTLQELYLLNDPVLAQVQYINEVYLLQGFRRCMLHPESYCTANGLTPGALPTDLKPISAGFIAKPEPLSGFQFGGAVYPQNIKSGESDTLDRLFNERLYAKYRSTENLRDAWGSLEDGEHLDPNGDGDASDGTVKRILYANWDVYTYERRMDTVNFYYNIGQDHIKNMYNFITNELGLGEIIITAIENFDGLPSKFMQNEANTLGQHIPWAHPDHHLKTFMDTPFDYINWPMLNGPVPSYIASDWLWWRVLKNTIWKSVTTSTVSGKPFILSEYNHPLPNEFQSEFPLLISSYALLQDWDGIVLHEYITSPGNLNNNYINKGFELESDSPILAQIPTAARIFRKGWINEGTGTVTIPFGEDGEYGEKETQSQTEILNYWWDCGPLYYCYWKKNNADGAWKQSLVHQTRMRFEKNPTTASSPGEPSSPYKSDTGQLDWDMDNGLLTVSSQKVNAAIGFPNSTSWNLPNLDVKLQGSSDFSSTSLIPLDGKNLTESNQMLVTLAGRVMNTNMTPAPPKSEGQYTLNSWGNSPVLTEAINAEISLSSLTSGIVSVYSLQPDGTRKDMLTQSLNGSVSFETGSSKSLWYLITIGPEQTGAVFRVNKAGDVFADCSFYGEEFKTGSADIAEIVRVSEDVEPGDLAAFDPTSPGQYRKTQSVYSNLAAGVISTDPGMTLSEPNSERNPNHARLALMGTVPVKATTINGPIKPGDLLTPASKPGYAMACKDTNKCRGAIIGKALEALTEGEGTIKILLM